MITLALLFLVAAFAESSSIEDCSNDSYKKVGCFKKDESLFHEIMITDLDPTHHKWGKDIDWADFQKSLHSLACRCAAKVRGKYNYFAIGFYGECWAGSNTKAIRDKAYKPDEKHTSDQCIGGDYEKCDKDSKHECAGKEDDEYVYEVVQASSYKCYNWNKHDLEVIHATKAYTREDQKKYCEGQLGLKFSGGNDKLASGCGACWCCQPVYGISKEYIGKTLQFKSENYPNRLMRHRGFEMWLDESNINANVYELDSTFRIVKGLIGTGISFQSVNYPKRYLRHRGYLCYIEENDGSTLFRNDASFIPEHGLFGSGTVSFESVNYPTYFLRHAGFRLRINKNDNSVLFKKDASWLPGRFDVPKEYKFDNRRMTWMLARTECQKWGGDLVTITSEDENTNVMKELKSRKMGRSWIGLNDMTAKTFTWVRQNGNQLYRKWRRNEPSRKNGAGQEEHCVEMNPDGTWNDQTCSDKISYVCEKTKVLKASSYKCYNWSKHDLEVLHTTKAYTREDQKKYCEGQLGLKFLGANEKPAYGCGGCWCCQPVYG